MAGFAAAIGAWLAVPGLAWALAALTLAVGAARAVVRARRAGEWVAVATAVVAGGAAVHTAYAVRRVERAWPDVREQMVRSASARLSAALGEAVDLARTLAARGADEAGRPQPEALTALPRAIRGSGPEHGIAIFDDGGRPYAWAGQHRVPPQPDGAELSARLTPFYVLIEARRQVADRRVIAHVLLDADDAVPDRQRSAAARFERRTGVALDFSEPDQAPIGPDVFDYCLPACTPTVVAPHPDTLFAVRTAPPTQGAWKLGLLEGGGRRAAILGLAALLLLAAFGGNLGRWVGVFGAIGLLIVSPVGERIGLTSLFSPGVYFFEPLGPLSDAAGPLLLTALIAIVAATQALRQPAMVRRWRVLVGCLALAAAPFAMWRLAAGVTPPSSEIDLGLWIAWVVTLASVAAAIGLAGALLFGPSDVPFSNGRWAAIVLSAGGLGLLGLVTWQPSGDWPIWYAVVWVVPAALAAWPGARTARLVAIGLVAGSGASLLTWGAVMHGRIALAAQDARRVTGGDPVVVGFLDRFAAQVQSAAPPKSSAELYASWRRSPLSLDDYPAVLGVWSPDGREVASLELARLDLRPPLFARFAAVARDSARPLVRAVDVERGVHYLAAIPLEDGAVVTVGVAPRSRLIQPVLVARFLRGERRLAAPYEVDPADHVTAAPERADSEWRRSGWAVTATAAISLPEGARHLHLTVPLGAPIPLMIRGALLALLDVLVLAAVAVLGDGFRRGLRMPPALRRVARFRSYRVRLSVALGAFFVIPTLGFAAWSAGRLRSESESSRDLVIAQTLRDAVGNARQFIGLSPEQLSPRLNDLAERLDADLAWYQDGMATEASMHVLVELGLLGVFLPPEVYRRLAFEDQLDVTTDLSIGGQPTRVGYRAVGGSEAGEPVLAAPRLVDTADTHREREDLLFGLLLATVLGLAGATGMATLAARTLARPVQSLRAAADAVGRREWVPPFDDDVPDEFQSVMEAFRRMARDVESSQRALEAARRRTATVLSHVATGVVALDDRMAVAVANRRAEELLGTALATGDRVAAVTAPAWTEVWRWVERFMREGAEHDGREFTVDGRRIRAQAAALHVDPRGCVVALDDTTDLTRAVRVLAWGELARQIAHEIKNPLTPIRLGVQHLQRSRRSGDADFDATLERTSEQILAEIERLDAIARAFARFGAPAAEAGPLAAVDAGGIAREVAALYALGGTRVTVTTADPPLVRARKDELKEVLVNLIENARDAGASGVEIHVADADPGRVRLDVEDDGRGISPEHLPRIFEPQFSTTTSGTGLGLAICKRLVESWEGAITVASGPGGGTSVRIEVAAA
jgi:signal transduction histidine kinase